MPHDIIIDADDFCEDQNGLDMLFRMKARFPKFKITMFAIPARGTLSFWREVKRLEWIRLAMHGFHHTWLENEKWTQFEADVHMRTVMGWNDSNGQPLFSRLYKCPQWRANQNTINALADNGLVMADNTDPASNPNGVVVPAGVRRYYCMGDNITDHHPAGNWAREHMHIGPKDCTNELSYMFHHILDKYSTEDNWHFIDDVVKDLYAGA